MTKHIRCAKCGQFTTYASSQPTPGGSERVHLHGVGCRKPTAEQLAREMAERAKLDLDRAYAEHREQLARTVHGKGFNTLAIAFARAGIAV
jgi:hypothetical protein